MNTSQNRLQPGDRGHRPGKLLVVGIGPGSVPDRTRRAEEAIRRSSVVVGYAHYLEQIQDLTQGKEILPSAMTREIQRCRLSLEKARAGAIVALVSSGDPGIYGMAGLALELAAQIAPDLEIEIIPGVSSAQAAASRLGAPLMLDYAVISLSDLLVPWPIIRQRLEAVATADLVVALYNPAGRKRIRPFREAVEIFLTHRRPSTPAAIARDLGGAEEQIQITSLERLPDHRVDMRSLVIIGNNSTKILGQWLVTPRGYDL